MYKRKLIKFISKSLMENKQSKGSGKKLATFGNLVADKIKKKK